MAKINNFIYYAAFVAIAILAFWQIALFVHPVKFDMIDCYYPWRYFIGENLQNGRLPFWNPYQNLGYPIHADPSSGAWYPLVWIIGYFSGYNVFTIGLEFIFHVSVAGIGFYKLAKTLKLINQTALMAGISYMLCGVFVGNAQHLGYVISAAWLPFVLNYYLKMAEEDGYLNSVKASLFLFLMISGGYPAFTLILFYLLLLFFISFIWKYLRKKNKEVAKLFIFRNVLFFVLTILLSAGILYSIYQVSPYIARTNQFELKNALYGPFSPQSAISFLLPFATVNNTAFFDTDFSMSNAYVGLPMLLFFMLGFFSKKEGAFKILFWFALFSLLASFGSYSPVRAFLFNYVPMMNIFRFPSVFRLFLILGIILTGAKWLNNYIVGEYATTSKELKRLVGVFILVLIIVVVYLGLSANLNLFHFLKHDLFVFSKTTLLSQHIAFQSVLQILVLGILYLVISKTKEKGKLIRRIAYIVILDLVLATQLNGPYTIFSQEFSAKACNTHIGISPKGFPLLNDVDIANVKPKDYYYGPFWKNLNIFQKQVSGDGFNSFAFAAYFHLTDDLPLLYAATTKNKIAFLSDHILDENKLEQVYKDSALTNDMVFFNSEDLKELNTSSLKHDIADTSQLISFAPDKFVVATKTKQAQVITLLQNDYIGWEVYVNDQQVKHYTTNSCLISAITPSGKNIVRFEYNNKGVRNAMWISLISLTGSLIILLIKNVFKKPQKF